MSLDLNTAVEYGSHALKWLGPGFVASVPIWGVVVYFGKRRIERAYRKESLERDAMHLANTVKLFDVLAKAAEGKFNVDLTLENSYLAGLPPSTRRRGIHPFYYIRALELATITCFEKAFLCEKAARLSPEFQPQLDVARKRLFLLLDKNPYVFELGGHWAMGRFARAYRQMVECGPNAENLQAVAKALDEISGKDVFLDLVNKLLAGSEADPKMSTAYAPSAFAVAADVLMWGPATPHAESPPRP